MKKVIVVGASVGGIQAVCSIIKNLPADFPSPLLVVIHTPEKDGQMGQVLQRCTSLKVTTPNMSEPLHEGRIYIAPPNCHLITRAGCAVATKGPRENRCRPAVDTLFRSAARTYRAHVVAVVLSGALDDGSAGALAIKARHGTVIVQDPQEAQMPDMPANVLRLGKADYTLPLAKIPDCLVKLAGEGTKIPPAAPTSGKCESVARTEYMAEQNEPVGFTCPDCGGTLLEIKDGKNVQLRCHVGHRFSFDSFSEAHADALERALWVAMRKLNERRAIEERLGHTDLDAKSKARHAEGAYAAKHDIELLEEILARL